MIQRSCTDQPLSLSPEIAVDRHRPGTTEDERREASKVEQVSLVARWSKLGMTGGHVYQLDRTEPIGQMYGKDCDE